MEEQSLEQLAVTLKGLGVESAVIYLDLSGINKIKSEIEEKFSGGGITYGHDGTITDSRTFSLDYYGIKFTFTECYK